MEFQLTILKAVICMRMAQVWALSGEEQGGEFCLMESLQAKCEEDEVVVMRGARYGRMQLGRCVKTDFGFVGCYEDVLHLADQRCSGRRSCVIRVPDPLFENQRPCNEEFKSFLEATYSCEKVATADPKLCQIHDHLKLTAPSGYIANVVTEETRCGGDDAPWLIEAKPGQKINLTLYDFTHYAGSDQARHSQTCLIYAFLRDGTSRERISICVGGQRVKNVHISTSHQLLVYIVRSYTQDSKHYFMLEYNVIGCADPIAQDGGWMKRAGNHVTMGCSQSEEVWELTCRGNAWVGKLGNCTPDDVTEYPGTTLGVLSLPVGLAVTLILAIAIGVSAGILLIGLFVIRKKRRSNKRRRQTNIVMTEPPYRGGQGGKFPTPGSEYETRTHNYGTTTRLGASGLNDNEYAYVWDTSPCPHHNMNIHEDGHVITTCPCLGEAAYEKSTLSRKSQDRGSEAGGAPQYFELDPQAASKCNAGQVDLLQNEYESGLRRNAQLHKSRDKSGVDKLNELRKYHLSEGQLDTGRPNTRLEEEEANKINNFLQNVTS